MAKQEIIIEKAEKELAELKDIFKSVDANIMNTGGQKSQLWLFDMKHKIYKLEDKIKDLKANTIRTDEIPTEGLKLEGRIIGLENYLGKTNKKEE